MGEVRGFLEEVMPELSLKGWRGKTLLGRGRLTETLKPDRILQWGDCQPPRLQEEP